VGQHAQSIAYLQKAVQYGIIQSGMAELDPTSSIPIYRQLTSHFICEIEAGRLREGERLPATRELAGQLGLNRTTVSAAYELLEAEGWIAGEVGRGSFVRSRVSAAADWPRLLTPSLVPRNPALTPVAISFAHSRPSEDLFPVDAFRESTEAVLRGPGLGNPLSAGPFPENKTGKPPQAPLPSRAGPGEAGV